MTTDDFSLDQVERSQREQTRRRRDKQSRRKQLYFLGGVVALALLVLAGPSLVCHSSMGRSMAKKSLAEYGFEGDVESLRVGWVTPLRAKGLQIHGAAGSQISVEHLDMDMTVLDICLLYTSPSPRDRQKSRMPSSA